MRNIGFHRQTVTIKTLTRSSDGAGGFTLASTSINVKAEVNPVRGMRTDTGGQIAVANMYEIKFLKRSEIVVTPRSEIVWNSKTLTIHSIVEENQIAPYQITILAQTNQ